MAYSHQASLSMGFPRQEYRSGLPFSSPGDLPEPGIKPTLPAWLVGSFITEPPGQPLSPPVASFKCIHVSVPQDPFQGHPSGCAEHDISAPPKSTEKRGHLFSDCNVYFLITWVVRAVIFSTDILLQEI